MDIIFIIISAIYITSLAVIDGMFNRLIFRKHRTLSYYSHQKQKILKLWEWNVITILFLFLIPIVIPCVVSLALGGVRYMLLYISVLLFIQWDIIFGKIVFNNWLGDHPSMSLPIIGYIHFPLYPVVVVRLLLFVITIFILLR